jgi:hypothetical protein
MSASDDKEKPCGRAARARTCMNAAADTRVRLRAVDRCSRRQSPSVTLHPPRLAPWDSRDPGARGSPIEPARYSIYCPGGSITRRWSAWRSWRADAKPVGFAHRPGQPGLGPYLSVRGIAFHSDAGASWSSLENPLLVHSKRLAVSSGRLLPRVSSSASPRQRTIDRRPGEGAPNRAATLARSRDPRGQADVAAFGVKALGPPGASSGCG